MSAKVESRFDVMLHRAASQGDAESILRILDTGRVHVDCCDAYETTALMISAAYNHLDCAKALLDSGAEVNRLRVTGTSAIFFASQNNNLKMLNLLLNHGAHVSVSSNQKQTHPIKRPLSPLFIACQCNCLSVVSRLLSCHADPNERLTSDGATPLFIASQHGHLEIVRALMLSAPTIDINAQRSDGTTALWIATQHGHTDIVNDLLRHGADSTLPRNDQVTPLFKASQKGWTQIVINLLEFYHPHKNNTSLPPHSIVQQIRECSEIARVNDFPQIVRVLNEALTNRKNAPIYGNAFNKRCSEVEELNSTTTTSSSSSLFADSGKESSPINPIGSSCEETDVGECIKSLAKMPSSNSCHQTLSSFQKSFNKSGSQNHYHHNALYNRIKYTGKKLVKVFHD